MVIKKTRDVMPVYIIYIFVEDVKKTTFFSNVNSSWKEKQYMYGSAKFSPTNEIKNFWTLPNAPFPAIFFCLKFFPDVYEYVKIYDLNLIF